ncbi:transporter [Brachybacterium phenoliresistens]|uniref:Transporter n=1 Tax=Brachybacterium phenoliresistens TaxID=396014 RepID=Z9JUC5_9MICO|nr:SLC13 family permease [Brachybacterium phenoliresistens]EWS81603.1 transporter [Brachybacterium phenoliresistens]
MSTAYLIGVAVLAIAILLFTVMKLRWPAFISLLFVSVLTAVLAGIPIQDVIPTVIEGMGGTLGNVALLVGLGAMLGGIIEKTGGAEIIAHRAAEVLGEKRLGPALLIASGLVAIPIFFDVAFIILVPIIFSFAKAAGHRSPIALGAPVAVLMVFIHNAVPPHPGIVGSTTLLGPEQLGLVTVLGILLAIPMGFLVFFLSGRIMRSTTFSVSPEVAQKYADAGAARFVAARAGAVTVPAGSGGSRDGGSGSGAGGAQGASADADASSGADAAPARRVTEPSAATVIAMILLPILLIACGTIGKVLLPEGSPALNVLSFLGAPGFALLVAGLLSMYVLGFRHGWGRQDLADVMDGALGPAAIVVFVTGAGGVFAKVLTVSGIGTAVSGLLVDAGVPVLLLAFLLALIFKVAQGSGTVATLTAAGLVQSTVLAGDFSAIQVALIILAIGMGSLALSHINDSGFWIMTRFLGLSVAGGLKTWTLMCTVLGFTGMAIISLAWLIVS